MDGSCSQKDGLRRLFCPQAQAGERLWLSPEEGHHLARVLRARAGQEILLLDGKGGLLLARVIKIDKKGVLVEGIKSLVKAPPPPALTLLQGLIKGERLRWLVQKATELGTTRIVLFQSRYSIVHRPGKEKLKTLERISIEALKQSGRLHLPEIIGPLPFKEALKNFRTATNLILHEKEEQRRLPEALNSAPLTLAVGPEGGFSPEEVELAQTLGYLSVRLSRATLRAETAALAAVAVAASKFDL
ncbi:16S rRNA (uracil(1498)-N(3))-methyltransferase [Thermosulfuriphilus ammonigenes]|uniref:Ribosomal RNA small subunit methyltransferase E n=1 Tax=Thermosulfuriphilus ammonigenes TaxID=1936021 RepID=A0A6G7PY50_9BACT|nr:RsmE family RNA methyltransferase [Thermosulfuriphilus ammonigenes]MBA2849834.1 16S rRNA (uracil1498-N3)-methyltransferase [Thermosulfuriphilus ammonigenes]QIJ72619.1 16S rRNA (uracil(1498)-N(3))-methyltransferase [Thermosulfuriphilus ammonigenes]